MIFQSINSVGSNNLSFKYKRFTPLGCKDIDIRKFEFEAKIQFFLPQRRKRTEWKEEGSEINKKKVYEIEIEQIDEFI